MSRRYTLMLLALGAIWGASYLFNEIALRELEPAALIEGRFLLGALTLLAVLPFTLGVRAALAAGRRALVPLTLAALLNAVLPFLLIAWGQQFVDSGLTGILLAASPLFTTLVALRYGRAQRVAGLRLAGVALGFVGVVFLLGEQAGVGKDALLGAAAVVAAAFLYSVAGLYIGERLADVPRLVVASGATGLALVLTLPLAIAQAPDEPPSWDTVGAIAALGIGGTGIAYLLYFAIISGAGASRAILVNYLIPLMAVLYGVTLLGEPFTAGMAVGLVLVLAGVGMATGRP